MYLAKTMKSTPEEDPLVKVRPSDSRFIFSGGFNLPRGTHSIHSGSKSF